ncbi:PREDICTED: protein D3-like, partial [Nicrophorus vespilloides]|uniref:Protein D3-like n=1 Tax=Nicrophorus vespilloides TaxID=110193 RepID=A0ABM1N0Z0_NICVS
VIIDLTYNKEEAVHFGTELTPTNVKDQPAVSYDANPDTYYTLSMVDPDAPSRKDPKFKEVNHWLVTNILGKDIKTGDVITAYLGSGPPNGTGLHRYVFLLFKQPKKLEFDEPKTEALSREHRLNFDVKKFAKKYNLGEPVAINFFKAQWDSYVDERNKKIKNKN